ncbi:18159_t:CDS:1 [Entrophospora sp. SA101]|nr:5469_t:CDS:1 [Entrophospora sp. SA101]CAJ0631991.1 4936_t:CDS:1 [Entrophospora sp. SA101]CAJ0759252.1 18159_t:CDS:1 [Entrophospora sp. SA101]CAJ0838264.1 17459_t:CDS:1 [Entrophospora sp. SA101]CAJ0846343.1 560_t:CDS:1 [Entrophospora sp. SA101]
METNLEIESKFKSILEEKSQHLNEDFLFRNISGIWDLDEKKGVLKYYAEAALKDVEIIKEIYQKWRDHNKEINEDIREKLFKVLEVFEGEESVVNKDKQILCYFYFLIVDYSFGYVYLYENDKKENDGHVNIKENERVIEVDQTIVIRKLMNVFSALEKDDFKDKRKAGIFFALIVMCNEFNINSKRQNSRINYLEKKGNKFIINVDKLCALRINYMIYVGIFPAINEAGSSSREILEKELKPSNLISKKYLEKILKFLKLRSSYH